jgi:hypothetical protein
MLRSLTVLLILSLSLYWFTTVGQVCQAPLTYALTALDERFNITIDEANTAITTAVSLWETAAGRELFVAAATGTTPDIAISFVFDERQERALAEESLRASLDNKEATSEDVAKAYEALVAEYKNKRAAHEAKVASYEVRLQAHNDTVAAYNATGGAPEAEFEALVAAEAALAREGKRLEAEGTDLATLAAKVNQLGETGNQIIRLYNAGVNEYNSEFGEPDEFTQGDYKSTGDIHIYTFADQAELTNVLAHELGHALDLPHVEGSASVMYYLMEDQPSPPVLSNNDVAAFTAQCGETGHIMTTIRTFINRYLI